MKILSREMTERHWQDFATSLGRIIAQTFKEAALLGGIEKTLKPMKEVITEYFYLARACSYA